MANVKHIRIWAIKYSDGFYRAIAKNGNDMLPHTYYRLKRECYAAIKERYPFGNKVRSGFKIPLTKED